MIQRCEIHEVNFNTETTKTCPLCNSLVKVRKEIAEIKKNTKRDRKKRIICYTGESKSYAGWADHLGICRGTVKNFIAKYGVEDGMTRLIKRVEEGKYKT